MANILLLQIWTVTFLGIVLTSIGVLCFETVPGLRIWHDDPDHMHESGENASSITHNNRTLASTVITPVDPNIEIIRNNIKLRVLLESAPHPILETIDTTCTIFFTIEFFARFFVSMERSKFFKNTMNIVDILCVSPMWIKYIMIMYEVKMSMELLPLFFVIMVLRVLRICRVLRLARHYNGVKILVLALKASFNELFMLVIFVFIVVLIFAVVIYYVEFFREDTFPTIPNSFWWAIITLTTVGYGDMYPKSVGGYVIGSMCALTGILATGLPVPIIANNFNTYYSHAKMKEQMKLKESKSNEDNASSRNILTLQLDESKPDECKESNV